MLRVISSVDKPRRASRRLLPFLLAGSCLAITPGAWGQAGGEPETTVAATTPVAPAAADDQSAGRDVVVVSARRRDEDAQDVPIALSVIGAQTLEQTGSYTLGQIQQLVPSLQVFSFNPRNTNILIRGLGSNVSLTNDGLENGVGFYVDNVYYGRPGQTQFDLVDLQQVEVLRGPQGTLFGKNTTAGAINITTRLPSFTPEYFGEVSAGDYGYKQVKASATGPLFGDTVAYRLTSSYTDRDGFIDNVRTGETAQSQETFTARGQLLIRPTDDIDVRLIGDFSEQHARCCINLPVDFFGTYDNGAIVPNNFVNRVARAGYTPLPIDPFARRTDADAHFQADMRAYGASGEVNWDLGSAKLTSISAYRWWDWYPANDSDGTGLSVNVANQQTNYQRQFSQEVRLASQGDNVIDYVVGGYYFWQIVSGFGKAEYGPAFGNWNYPTQPAVVANTATNGFRSESRSTPRTASYAAFGQATWNVSEAFKLTAGLRFTHEEKDGSYIQAQVAGLSFAGLTQAQAAAAQAIRNQLNPVTAYSASLEDDDVSSLLSASYALTPDVLVYGSWAKGGKSGGLNLTNLPTGISPGVSPEAVENYEIGLKSTLFDGALVANAAIYNTEIEDYQTAIVEQVPNTVNLRQYIANIPKVRSRGAEADFVWTATDELSFTASASYSDAAYVDYANAPQTPENLNLAGTRDLSGKQLSGAPKFTYSLGADYVSPLELGQNWDADIYLHADYAERTAFYTSASNSRFSRVAGYGLLNVRAGLRSADSVWDVSIWARNLLDEAYFQTLTVANTGLVTGLIGEPRTVGATLKSRF